MRLFLVLLVVLVACTAAQPPRALPSYSRQVAIREEWLQVRHAALLELLRKHDVGMWIVVNEEFHADPMTALVAPPRPYAGNRDFFVFIDAGDAGLKRYAVTGFAEEALTRFFDSPAEPRKQKETLAELYATYRPRSIALATGGRRGVTRSLTHDTHQFLVEAMGEEAKARFVPAAPLLEDYLDTRIPGERPVYLELVKLTEAIVRRALSREVITPGVTTVGQVRAWLYDELDRQGVDTWFQPDLRVQRAGLTNQSSRGFLAVAPESRVIERGDLVHIDFGVSAMGLDTDWQKMAYVLKEGERGPPPGLVRALGNTRALQDAVMAAGRPGTSTGDVYREVMDRMADAGITAMIYSHPLGNHGHGLGPSVDFRSAQRGEAPSPLRAGSYMAMELNTRTPVPEWNGQEVFIMEEDPVELTDAGWVPFVPLQTELYLVP